MSCQEVDAVKNKTEAVPVKELWAEPRCIVQHPGFQAMCLKNGFGRRLQYKQQYGSSRYDRPQHKENHHIAQRQLVRWCWSALGKNICLPFPSCTVNCIHAHFGEPTN